MAHALPAHLGQRDLDAALLADHSAVLEALVLAAQTLVIASRAEDLGAEQAVALRLEGAVVDGLGLFDFAVRTRSGSCPVMPGRYGWRRTLPTAPGIEQVK
jgi:hypothetical protein